MKNGDTPSDLKPPDVDLVSDSDHDSEALPDPVIVIDSDQPAPKRYAHYGKRRRSFTDELFRCQYVDKISRSDLVCNALLWKNRPEELRKHLLNHLKASIVMDKTDAEVIEWYTEAKRIFLETIPEDTDPDLTDLTDTDDTDINDPEGDYDYDEE